MPNSIKQFYSSIEWQKCREAYKKKVGYLCEECLKHGIINPCDEVHHIRKITRSNLNDPSITLSEDNLEALCSYHHRERHGKTVSKRYFIDKFGHVHPTDRPPE